MYQIRLTNFGWLAYNGQTFCCMDSAKKAAKEVGYEATIEKTDGTPVAAYSVIGGFRVLLTQVAA